MCLNTHLWYTEVNKLSVKCKLCNSWCIHWARVLVCQKKLQSVQNEWGQLGGGAKSDGCHLATGILLPTEVLKLSNSGHHVYSTCEWVSQHVSHCLCYSWYGYILLGVLIEGWMGQACMLHKWSNNWATTAQCLLLAITAVPCGQVYRTGYCMTLSIPHDRAWVAA